MPDWATAGVAGFGLGVGLAIGVLLARMLGRWLNTIGNGNDKRTD